MHPGLGPLLADWLDEQASHIDLVNDILDELGEVAMTYDGVGSRIARLILGTETP
jgi:hypothetical protein